MSGREKEIGKFLIVGGLICILVWALLHILWVIGLGLILAGLILYLINFE